MKKITILLFVFLTVVRFSVGQTPTVSIDDHTAVPGSVTIPVEFTDFVNIGAITLYIEYDQNVASYVSYNPGAISNVIISTWQSGSNYILGISWTDVAGLTSTGGTLIELVFNYTSGTTALNFQNNCELGNLQGDVVAALYSDGSISPDPNSVPITIIDQLNQTPQAPPNNYVEVPIDVNFSNVANGGVGSFNFEIEYDNTILTFDQITEPFEPGITVNTLTNPARVSIVWTTSSPTSGSSLNGTLLKMKFTYNGGNSDLTFVTSACEIADFIANPLSAIYTNGMVTQDPTTMTNIIINSTSAQAGAEVLLPVTVKNFNNVGAFDYVIDFNTQVLQFIELTSINPAITSGLLYNTMGNLYISWTATNNGVTLSDNETLFVLKFSYSGTNTDVTFIEENCSMSDYDTDPINAYYVNGQITEISGGNVTVSLDTIVSPQQSYILMPVEVTGFTNVGAITLEINYQETLLQFDDIESIHNELTDHGSYLSNGGGGTYTFSWTVDGGNGQGINIDDNDKLFYIKLFYITGTADMQFNHSNCDISDWDAVSYNVSYSNGLVKGGVQVNLKVFLQGLYNTVTHEMNKAQDYVGGIFVDKFAGTVVDEISVELHDATNYSIVHCTISNIELNQDGTASFEVPELYTGSYYLTIRNRNHIETVSKNIVSFASGFSYDFTTAANKAYGDNQTEMETGVFGIYAGDVTQDGVINIADRESINNDYLITLKGYCVTDVNGDGIINIIDREITNNAYLNTIIAILP